MSSWNVRASSSYGALLVPIIIKKLLPPLKFVLSSDLKSEMWGSPKLCQLLSTKTRSRLNCGEYNFNQDNDSYHLEKRSVYVFVSWARGNLKKSVFWLEKYWSDSCDAIAHIEARKSYLEILGAFVSILKKNMHYCQKLHVNSYCYPGARKLHALKLGDKCAFSVIGTQITSDQYLLYLW